MSELFDWNGEKMRIRPSAIDAAFTCPFQWAGTFIGGITSIPNARAAMGTAIHKGIEEMWKEVMATKEKKPNLSMMHDAAVDEFRLLDQEDDLYYDNGETLNSAVGEISGGINAFVEDILPFTDIPTGVEQRYTIPLQHNMVEDISGTLDYIKPGVQADVKTSKRKPVPNNYTTQQSVYKLLVEANGVKVDHVLIQGIVLKTAPQGHILELEPDVDKAKRLVNILLDTLDVFYQDKIAPEILFRPNPKHYLCSEKYCNFYGKQCPATGGVVRKTQVAVKL